MDPLALVAGDLGDDVGGRAEAVEAERLAVAGHTVRAVADEAGAEQRRRFGIAEFLRQAEAIAPVGDHVLGVAAVDVAAGEVRRVAEILHARQAEAAVATGPAKPGHADALAEREVADAGAQRLNPADDLVSGHDRIARLRQFAVGDMQVSAAHAAGENTNQNLTGTRLRLRPVRQPQWLARPIKNHRTHGKGYRPAAPCYQAPENQRPATRR